LPVNYAGDLTSLGLSTKFDIDGDIQSSLKFTTDAPVWLQKKVETPWGAPIQLGAAAANDVGVFNCLYVNFAFWAKQAGEGYFSIGLLNNAGGDQIGFLTIPLNGTDEMRFISGGQTVYTGIKLDLAGFDEWHQFTIKYLRSWTEPQKMQVEVYVNGVLRFSPAVATVGVANFGLDTVAIAKFGECTCAIDDLIIDGGIISNVEQDSYSTKDKFILSLPPVPKRTVQPHEMNLVFKDYHDISILHPIKENFDNSTRYVTNSLRVKDKTAVMIIKGEGSLDLARMCNGNWDPDTLTGGDLGSDDAADAWKEAELIDLSSGYSSYIRQKRNVGSSNALAHAQDLFTSGSTQTEGQNRADSFWVSYAVIGSNSSHGITKGAYTAPEPNMADVGTFDALSTGAGMPLPGGGN